MGDHYTILRTDASHRDFISLVRMLDQYLAVTDGNDHAFYAPYNTIDQLSRVVLLYTGGTPVACGALKELEPGILEVKRMFTHPEFRGCGYAKRILLELENWAREAGGTACRLETGRRMPDAVALYHQSGYSVIPNYGQYAGVENSICFEKILVPPGI